MLYALWSLHTLCRYANISIHGHCPLARLSNTFVYYYIDVVPELPKTGFIGEVVGNWSVWRITLFVAFWQLVTGSSFWFGPNHQIGVLVNWSTPFLVGRLLTIGRLANTHSTLTLGVCGVSKNAFCTYVSGWVKHGHAKYLCGGNCRWERLCRNNEDQPSGMLNSFTWFLQSIDWSNQEYLWHNTQLVTPTLMLKPTALAWHPPMLHEMRTEHTS